MLAEIITIGDEILIGQIVDTNSAWMAKELNAIGIRVKQISSVSDDAEHIIEALTLAQKRAKVIIITGGLGPTKDDITKITLAKFFNMGMRRDAGVLEDVEAIFKRNNRPMIDLNIRQADVPDGCTVIRNKNGTAPGMWFEQGEHIIVSMPGVPFEMMYMMGDEVLPKLTRSFSLPYIYHKTILTANLGESFLAQQIADIEDSLPPAIKLAYLPKLGQVRLRLSTSGPDEQQLKDDVEVYARRIVERLKPYVVAEDDIALEQAILNIMKEKGLTLSTAESCTGGYISHLITKHPGCSAVFAGGAVTYSYELKESLLGVLPETLYSYGAVSEQTVTEMAKGAILRFNTDYSVAVSGIAGPDGGKEDKPVGTVWIAVANRGRVVARVFNFGNKRIQNIERSASSALSMVLNLLKEDVI
ncbi:competence/damage-inducible protein A [Pedobacter sp. MC2016-15]|uniref:competence/damage-inducible protein A n=1 Tax=Pedobacter sp. MC2016-15 TaxID=2994473 RepID=UPI00224519E8|nr:competence/damage-inducible protein A [Pedobacter sp. MC2016-15]MCX2477641.1 competence/damage-inducible protein A [Pedobacter sp. MC2016-15]